VVWVPLVGIEPGVHFVKALLLVSAVAAALLPQHRSARLAAFLGLFLYHALINSFGKISHSWHAWFLCAFVLVFLPGGPTSEIARSRRRRQHYLNAFASAQAFQLLFYSMSGIWKILGSAKQIALGEVHSLAPQALSMHIAHRLLRTDSESVLGPLFIENPMISWPSFLVTLYLQAFAIVAAFRPSLHRVWGLALIGFHTVVLLTMAVPFAAPVLLLGIFFLCSPFAPEPFDWRRCARDLPVLGGLVRRLLPPASASPAASVWA
jgi:hypothetical protein